MKPKDKRAGQMATAVHYTVEDVGQLPDFCSVYQCHLPGSDPMRAALRQLRHGHGSRVQELSVPWRCMTQSSSSSSSIWRASRNLTVIPIAKANGRARHRGTMPPSAFSSLLVFALVLLHVMFSLPMLALAQYYPTGAAQLAAPAGCEWRSRGSHGSEDASPHQSSTSHLQSEMLLACHFRTLNGALDAGANLTLIPAERTHGLALQCEDILFESQLPNRSFERLHQLRELHIDRCKLSELQADLLVGLTELRQLSVRTRNSDWGDLSLRLSPALFAPVRLLESVDLSENGLTQLPSPLFCPLTRLQLVNVSANQITEVAALGFRAKSSYDAASGDCRRLDSVTHLDASHNGIKVLTDRGFSRLHRLQELNLHHNRIVRAEETPLAGLAELAKLDLSNNQLVALPPRFFQAVKSTLAEVYLQNNSISVIPPGLFAGLSQVTVLDLSHNEVTSHWINPSTFSDMSRLLSLDLSYNKLSRVDAAAFRALYTLQSLSLQHNQIESLVENAFSTNRNLHTLSLSGNRLKSLDAASFAGLEVLNALALDGNGLIDIHPAAFANISGSLVELNLAQNRLGTVPVALTSLHHLRSLDLSYNRIREISNATYRGLEQLYGLNLEGNLIGNLTRGDFLDLPALRVLNLAHNRIAAVEQNTFDNIPDLHALRLDSNGLVDINGLFLNLRDLLMLNISANRIVMFDYALIPVGLQWLDIHDNQIEILGNYFEIEADLKLRTLDASFNRLEELKANSVPDGIELLMLNHNSIRKISPHTFMKKANLTRADLSDNRLVSLDLNSLRLSKVPARRPLPEFSIAGNPFLCDCNIDWLQRAAISPTTSPTSLPTGDESRQYPRVVDAHLIQCRLAFSRAPQIMPLASVKSSQFLCNYRSHCFELCHCCEFDACDCEMTCPDNCTCYYDQSWNTNIVDCGVNQHQNVPGRIPMDVTDLYLDGNNIPELSPHTFIGRKNLRHLHLNSSHIRAINNRTFNGLKSLLVLNLADNELDTLYGYEFERLSDLRELYLQNNRISVISNRTFTALRSLHVLRLDHNLIVEFELWTGLANSQLGELYLGANAWSCECNFVGQMLEWLPMRSDVIRDLPLVHCQYNETYSLPLAMVASTDVNVAEIEAVRANISHACSHYAKREPITAITSDSPVSTVGHVEAFMPVLVLIGASSFGVLLLLATIITAILYRHELSVWFYAKTGIRMSGGSTGVDGKAGGRRRRRRGEYGPDEGGEKLFDAFVSYSKKDEAFVSQMLAPELEFGTTPMRLCLHYRDLPVASGYVSDAIVEAMAASRRSILVISEHFLRNEWCHYEFKSAHQEALRSGRARHKLILIFVGPVAGKDLDPDIRVWLKTAGNTCLQWGEKMFWEKLRYALPEISATTGSSNSSSSSTTSSLYGRKGVHHHLGKGNGTLPALTATSLSQSALAGGRPMADYLQQQQSHPLLSAGLHSTTLGRGNPYHHPSGYLQQGQQSESHLYSPASVHSQQSTYAYPTYHPNMHQMHHFTTAPHSTPPPLPPSHPLHPNGRLSHHGHHSFPGPPLLPPAPGSNHSGSTTATSLESTSASQHHHGSHHLPVHLQNSSNESSLVTSAVCGGGSDISGQSQLPFVPSASSTTAVAVHI